MARQAPGAVEEAMALACSKLRYQPELEQVKAECQPYLKQDPGASE